jgi:hypothetical protein
MNWKKPKTFSFKIATYRVHLDQTYKYNNHAKYPGTNGYIFEIEVNGKKIGYAVENRDEYSRWVNILSEKDRFEV